ncbi:MAG: agmatine deiminase [Actinomycetota bacterium]|nr:agmatine deiminase [Actinomycetota bacterium]
MPAEWAPHEMTLVAWPQREEAWRGTTIEEARDSHAEVVAAISEFEPVLLVVDPSQAVDARGRVPEANVEIFEAPIDDSWIRDSGPIIVIGGGNRAGVDFVFNSWGEAFTPYDSDAAIAGRILDHLGIERIPSEIVLEGGSVAVNGEGILITTGQCLLDPTRNPGLDRESIGSELAANLGVEQIVWLGQGLVEDGDTDGHVDNICAFIDPGRVLLQTAPEGDPNFENAIANREMLTASGIEVIELDLLPRIDRDGESIVVPYTNFYVANDALIVPVSGIDPDMDAQALEMLGRLYPGREAVGIDGRNLALGGGGIHCITQQVPSL